MSIVTMTSTVGPLVNGQTYRVRAKYAEALVAQSKATKLPTRHLAGPGHTKEGL